jgi:hypothetical protein
MDWFHHRKPTIWTMLRLQARSTLKSMRCDNVFSPYTLKSKRYAALFTFHETFFRRWRVGDGFLLQARGFFSPYAAASSRPSRVRAWVRKRAAGAARPAAASGSFLASSLFCPLLQRWRLRCSLLCFLAFIVCVSQETGKSRGGTSRKDCWELGKRPESL